MHSLLNRIVKAFQLSRRPALRRGLMRHGIAAAIEHRSAIANLGVRSVIDVGANKGQFSLLVRDLFPDIQIHAFEPLPGPAARFRALFADDSSVNLHEVALGPTEGQADIHISGREDSSSLLPILDRQKILYPGTEEVGVLRINVVRGDNLIDSSSLEQPLLVKLDVQGYEKEALLGMPVILTKASHVYTEVSFQKLYGNQVLAGELIQFLQERGFMLEAIYNLSTDEAGQPVYADALFTREP